jgi:transposase
VIPRQWKVIQYVREKFTCRACETPSQAPAPFHVISRGRSGANLLAMVLYAEFGLHQPLNRQSANTPRKASIYRSRLWPTTSVPARLWFSRWWI